MKTAIRQKALELGFDQCGFTLATRPDYAAAFETWLDEGAHGEMGYLHRNAHKRVDPTQVLQGAKSIICLAAAYPAPGRDSNSDRVSSTGEIARYARFTDYHDVLAPPLKALTAFVNELQNEPSDSKKSLWYIDTGPFLERDLAQRAGLGFVGKHTNLISRQLGNWFFLCEIITTLELEPEASEPNRCGNCVRCIDACPTEAITAPFRLDARKCISYLTIELKGSIPGEYRKAIGTRIYGCDDCLEVCPWNRFAKDGHLMKQAARSDLTTPDLIELLNLDDEAFRNRFRGTPMYRTKRRGILRNVCVALGNSGDASTLPHLERATHDAEPLVAEHARWAISQIEDRCGKIA